MHRLFAWPALAAVFLLCHCTNALSAPTVEHEGPPLPMKQESEYQHRLGTGVKAFADGRIDEARGIFTAILKIAPAKILPHLNLGIIEARKQNCAAAIPHFDKVIKSDVSYKGAAVYYKALCQLNLDHPEEATKTARGLHSGPFYKPTQELLTAIREGKDTYLEKAALDLAGGKYAECLVNIQRSLFSDALRGRELNKSCINALNQQAESLQKAAAQAAAGEQPLPARKPYSLFFDGHAGYSDNLYEEDINKIGQFLFGGSLGGEYLLRGKADVGVGASYDYNNAYGMSSAAGQSALQSEAFRFYLPGYLDLDRHHFTWRPFFEQARSGGYNSYSDYGALVNYAFVQKAYSLGFNGKFADYTPSKTNPSFSYQTGFSSSGSLVGAYYLGQLTLSGDIGVEQDNFADQVIGNGVVPIASTNSDIGVSAAYAFNARSSLTFLADVTHKVFSDVVSANKTQRRDWLYVYNLNYEYVLSPLVRLYLRQRCAFNNSNYGNAEIINRNFTENQTMLGAVLATY